MIFHVTFSPHHSSWVTHRERRAPVNCKNTEILKWKVTFLCNIYPLTTPPLVHSLLHLTVTNFSTSTKLVVLHLVWNCFTIQKPRLRVTSSSWIEIRAHLLKCCCSEQTFLYWITAFTRKKEKTKIDLCYLKIRNVETPNTVACSCYYLWSYKLVSSLCSSLWRLYRRWELKRAFNVSVANWSLAVRQDSVPRS